MPGRIKSSFPVRLFLLFLAFQILLGYLSYHKGFPCYFLQDDFSISLILDRNQEVHLKKLLNTFFPQDEAIRARHRYRPLPACLIASDYFFFRVDPYGYRLTNLGLHLLCVLCVMILARRFLNGHPRRNALAFLAGLLFNLYPIHPHVVTWIGARSDSLATLFCLAALLLFHNNLLGKGVLAYFLALLSLLLALLSKELAITLPFVLVLLSLIFSEGHSLFKRAWKSIPRTLPFFLILAAYFGFRKLLFGEFVGSYGGDQSALSLAGTLSFLRDLPEILFKMLVPVNEAVFPKGEEVVFALFILPAVFLPLLSAPLSFKRIPWKSLLFFLGWCCIAFLPQMSVMRSQPRLERGRFFYPVIVPFTLCLSLFVGMPLISKRSRQRARLAGAFLAAVVLSLAYFFALQGNLWPFLDMGKLSRAIPQEIIRRHRELPETTRVVFLNTPRGYNGGPLYIFGLELAVRRPFNSFDIPLKAYPPEKAPPLEKIIEENPRPLAIYSWNSPLRRIDTIRLPEPGEGPAITLLVPPDGAELDTGPQGIEFSFRSSVDFPYYQITFSTETQKFKFFLNTLKLSRTQDGAHGWNLLESDAQGRKIPYPPPQNLRNVPIAWSVAGGQDPGERFGKEGKSATRSFIFR